MVLPKELPDFKPAPAMGRKRLIEAIRLGLRGSFTTLINRNDSEHQRPYRIDLGGNVQRVYRDVRRTNEGVQYSFGEPWACDEFFGLQLRA